MANQPPPGDQDAANYQSQNSYQRVASQERSPPVNQPSQNQSGDAQPQVGEDGELKEDLVNRPSSEQQSYGVSLKFLTEVVTACQNRNKYEEIEMLNNAASDGDGQAHILQGLQTQMSGLNPNEMEKRVRAFGSNALKEREPKTFMDIIWETLDDFVMKILIACAIVNLLIAVVKGGDHMLLEMIDGFAILCAVVICTLVAAVNDYQKEQQFLLLQQAADQKQQIKVMRQGSDQPVEVHPRELVVGDIFCVEEGIQISCDGLLLKGSEVKTDESAMTGETDDIKKECIEKCMKLLNELDQEEQQNMKAHSIPSPIMMSGTKIVSGTGFMLVISVGKYSVMGKIQEKILDKEDKEGTPLEQKLEKIANDIGIFGLVGASTTFFALLAIWIWNTINDGFEAENLIKILDYFIVAVAIVVMAIPEGLPLAVTLSLAFSVKKMLADKNLVKQLAACETMGGADCICSDKTGTLTTNRMTLEGIFMGFNNNQAGKNYQTLKVTDGTKYDFTNKDLFQTVSEDKEFQHILKNSFAINSTATHEKGNSTEQAIVKFYNMISQFPGGGQVENYMDLRKQWITEEKDTWRLPFTSKRKRMSTVIKTLSGQGSVHLIKGAGEYIMNASSAVRGWDGEIEALTPEVRGRLNQLSLEMKRQQFRVIAFAYKECTENDILMQKDKAADANGVYPAETGGFTLHSVVGIRDVIRDSVPGSILKCQKAGIKVRMVTGDNKDTAEAIAKGCGIIDVNDTTYTTEEHVWVGEDFYKAVGPLEKEEIDDPHNKGQKIEKDILVNQDKFNEIYKKIDVIARCRPDDKFAMVLGLIHQGHVVAVTGDGTNDAPALKKADVGFAMGNAGTQIAREASDIILMDDNFTSIVSAVMWGRNIYDSIRKFLQFQLTINVVAVCTVFICSIFLSQSILTPVQMLWVNLIMDTFAALALATEPPTEALLDRPPHSRNDYIVSGMMAKHIGMQTIFQMIVLLVFTFATPSFVDEPLKDTDSAVTKRFTQDKAYDICEMFADGTFENPFKDAKDCKKTACADCLANLQIMQNDEKKIRSGIDVINFGTKYEYKPIYKFYGPSRHFTLLFNVFVWMQIFNFLNARKIEDELNIFANITASPMFLSIVVLIILLQILCIVVGNRPLACSPNGLSLGMWGWSIAVGIIGIPWGTCIKLMPSPHFEAPESSGDDQKKLAGEDGQRGGVTGLVKKTSSVLQRDI